MTIRLGSVFTDHMLLQRDLPIRVSGSAAPGARVHLRFGAAEANGRADPDGLWKLALPPMPASSEPRELIATAAGDGVDEESVSCRDVLVGEVWVCSGQSNMGWRLGDSDNAEAEIAAATFPGIRLFNVPKRIGVTAQGDVVGASWMSSDPRNVADFSAVAYFFARELHRRLGVPIGAIHSSWGGTPAESWVSREGLLSVPELHSLVQPAQQTLEGMTELQEEYRRKVRDNELLTRDTENQGLALGWAGASEPTGTWRDMRLPTTWQSQGLKFSGVLWFRKVMDLPAAWAGRDLELAIGSADKGDITYFNGAPVGSVTPRDRADSWCFKRIYTVPGALVNAGRNVIAVRVHSDFYDGGLRGPDSAMYVRCPADARTPPIPLAGMWRYAIEKNYGLITIPAPPFGPDNPATPSTLFDGMIAPLLPLSIRGVIWYQGEANVSRSGQYGTLFRALIRDWRAKWGSPDLPFHFVQLANISDPPNVPGDSDWARLREAQTTALSLPQTGMAVAIDVGDAVDVHPRNKQAVGLRLALSALHTTYGFKDVVPSGPRYRAMSVDKSTVRLRFDHVDGGLDCRGDHLLGFAIAGDDQVFHWATATIEGDIVRLHCDAVPKPVAVRYAWADNPVCNLYNKAALPAVPFRTDTW